MTTIAPTHPALMHRRRAHAACTSPRRCKGARAVAALALLIVLAGCVTAPRNPLAHWRPSPNHDARRAQLVVLHATAMDSADAALLALRTRNAGGPVSAHYLVAGDGRLYQLVPETARAWHAGTSRWGGIEDLNSASIGIELDNDGHSPFGEAQIASLLRLLADVTTRLRIAPHLVVGHGDIAPARKRDPGVWFPWQRLAAAGFGLWPRTPLTPAPPGFDRWAALRLIGYDLGDPGAALRAFHRHFRASESGHWEPGDGAILYDLQRQLTDGMAGLSPTPASTSTPTPAPAPAPAPAPTLAGPRALAPATTTPEQTPTSPPPPSMPPAASDR